MNDKAYLNFYSPGHHFSMSELEKLDDEFASDYVGACIASRALYNAIQEANENWKSWKDESCLEEQVDHEAGIFFWEQRELLENFDNYKLDDISKETKEDLKYYAEHNFGYCWGNEQLNIAQWNY